MTRPSQPAWSFGRARGRTVLGLWYRRPAGKPLQSRTLSHVPHRFVALLVLACLVGAACSPPAFDPSGPCVSDGRVAGAYPDLEDLVPAALDGRAANRLDSGRSCSERSLGSLIAAGVRELRFAGGLWERGSRSGTTLAVFRGGGLTADALATWYESGARSDTSAEDVEVIPQTIAGVIGRRIDSLVETSSFQSVIVWDAPSTDTVRVILVATDIREQSREVHEQGLDAGLVAWLGSLPPRPAG